MKRRVVWHEVLGGRKFILAVLALNEAFVLALMRRPLVDFVLVASVSVGAFAAANAFVTGKGTERTPKAGKDV
jgi:hypothetical protein